MKLVIRLSISIVNRDRPPVQGSGLLFPCVNYFYCPELEAVGAIEVGHVVALGTILFGLRPILKIVPHGSRELDNEKCHYPTHQSRYKHPNRHESVIK